MLNRLAHRWLVLLLALCLVACDATTEATPAAPSPPPSATTLAQGGVDSPAAPAGEDAPHAVQRPAATATVPAAPSPAPTATALLATATPVPPTATATATEVPAPRLIQLTSGGCCTQPVWSPDGQAVRFLDRPSAAAPVGIWGVPVAQPGTAPTLVTERIGTYAARGEFFVEPTAAATLIERLSDGSRWSVSTNGDIPAFSPDRTRIAWDVQDRSLPFNQRVSQIWVSNLDGSEARAILTLPRGGLEGWLSNEQLLLSGRDNVDAPEERLFTVGLVDGAITELARADRIRSEVPSPDGSWLVYTVSQSRDPAQNGLWLVRTDGSERYQLPAELFGAYQWRDDGHLLLVPLRADATFHELWEWDAAAREARRLTDPAATPFKIANGDWRVSPDGQRVVFVESRDDNIWVIELP